MSPRTDNDDVILDLLEAVADARGDDVTELPPLSEQVDTGALGRYLTKTTVPTKVYLEVYGCNVMIDDEGTVTVLDEEDH